MDTSRIAKVAIVVTVTSVICAFIPRPAQATVVTFTGSGSGFNIPDGNSSGAFSDIVVADNFLISDITVDLNSLTHTFAGDLIATLTHIDTNTTVSLFNRNRKPPESDGDTSNLSGTYSFNDAFTGDLWAAAFSASSTLANIPDGNYFPTGAGSGVMVPMLTTISGLPSSGTWRLNISDNLSFDTGTLGNWSLNLKGSRQAAPVPGPLPLLGAGAAIGWSRQLRKRSRAAL